MTPDPTHRFAATTDTSQRWRRRKAPTWTLALVLVLFAVLNAWRRHSAGLAVTYGVVAVVIFGAAFGYTRYRRVAALPAGVMWHGGASLYLADLQRAGFAGSIRFTSQRRYRVMTMGVGGVSGRFELTKDGISFQAARLARFVGVQGAALIPWTALQDVQIGNDPGSINKGLGGAFCLVLKSGDRIDGTFLGPRDELISALAQAPLGK